MKKLLAKIIGATTALAMAIGVVAGVANYKYFPVHAETATMAAGSNSSSATVNSKSAIKCGSGSNKGTMTITLANANATSLSIYVGGWNNDTGRTVNITVTAGVTISPTTFDVSNESGFSGSSSSFTIADESTHLKEFTLSNAVANTVITFTAKNASKNRYVAWGATYTIGSGNEPTIESVSVTGDMNTKSYNSVERWDDDGLTPAVTMSDSSSYSGDIDLGFDPITPGEMIKENSGNEVVDGTLRATATASGESGYLDVTGISVNYATVAELAAATPASGDLEKVVVRGIVSQTDTFDITTYHNATYYISDDGTTTNQYEVYRGKGVDNADITNANDIKVGDTVVVYGDVYTYNQTKEFKQGNYLLSLDRPAASEPEITITNASFSMFVGDSDVVVEATANNIPDGGSVVWVSSNESVATVSEVSGDYKVHAVAAGSINLAAKILNSSSEVVAQNSITVTILEQALEDNDAFIIKATYDASTYYMTGVSVGNLGTASTTKSDAMVFTAIEGATPGQFQIKNSSNYLSFTGSSNAIYTTTNGEAESTYWTAINNGSEIVIENVSASGRKLKFNYNSGNTRFACYTSAQTSISIEKVEAPEVDEVIVAGDPTANANNELSIAKEFSYEVSYVNPLVVGTSAVSVDVRNSSDGTDGASVTTAPLGGTFVVTFTASDTYTITVTSSENPAKSDSTIIVVSNIYAPVLTDFNLYEGETLVEGDYVISYDNGAINTSIDGSSRIQYDEITPVADVVSTDSSDIVWHIAHSGSYFTIYNKSLNKYLASTGAKSKAALITDGTDDKAKWSVEVDISEGTFDFTNKYNDEHSVNAKLRKNSTYGFACYAAGTGGALTLYKKNAKSEIEDNLRTRSSLSYNYTKLAENSFEYSDVVLRFGGIISKALWDELDTNSHIIQSYGVFLSEVDEVEALYKAELESASGNVDTAITELCSSGEIINYNSLGNNTIPSPRSTPALFLAENYDSLDEDTYIWNLCVNATADLTKEYTAVAYIRTSAGLVFVNETTASAKSLASSMLSTYGNEAFGGSLYSLAHYGE